MYLGQRRTRKIDREYTSESYRVAHVIDEYWVGFDNDLVFFRRQPASPNPYGVDKDFVDRSFTAIYSRAAEDSPVSIRGKRMTLLEALARQDNILELLAQIIPEEGPPRPPPRSGPSSAPRWPHSRSNHE